jgi:SNF2 family DNA or RNA helicase
MLRPYQWEIALHIINTPRCNVWASMGAGKTLSTLIAADMLNVIEPVFPVLIVAPKRVAHSVWMQEAAKWEATKYLRVERLTGTATNRHKALNRTADIYTINFEALPWLISVLARESPFRTIIVDEASRLKGFRSRGGSKRCAELNKIAHGANRFVNLTGTPAPNSVMDLWGQMWFIDQGERLGRTFSAFRDRWFDARKVGRHQFAVEYVPKPNADREIRELIKDVTITVDVADHMDISEPVLTTVPVELPRSARATYDDMERQMYAELTKGEVEAVNAASRTSKCHQIANGALYLDDQDGAFDEIHDAKLCALESIIEESAGEPVLVAYQFKHDLARLKARFKHGVELTHGDGLIDAWNRGEVPLMFVHPQSAGHGLNLAKGGHILAFFSLDWNLEYHLQVIERVGPTRQAQLGTGKPCLLYYIVAENTVDELIVERLQTKKSVQQVLTDAMKRRATCTTQ